MSTFRMVHTEFWNDPKVIEEMTPEDKYFFLYLLTNPNTTQIGIYQITKKQMAFDMGYSMETIDSLLDRFLNHHKLIKYNEETREIAIKNWGKYNLRRGGKPMMDCVEKELQEVKDKSLIDYIGKRVSNSNIKALYDTYHDTCNDTPTIRGQYKEEEKEKEEYIYMLFEYWNSKKIIVHRKMNQAMKSHINARLEEYSVDELKKAIDNYNEILKSDNYYWTHKWSLQDFMKPNNVTRFVDDADPLENFKKSKNNGPGFIKEVNF